MWQMVLFYLDRLGVGGPERVVLNLVAGLAKDGWQPAIALNLAEGELLEAVPAGVPVFDLGAKRASQTVFRLAALVRRERPAILVSQRAYLNVIAVLAHGVARTTTRLVLAEHTMLARWLRDKRMPHRRVDRLLPYILPRLYGRAAAIVGISRGVAKDLRKVLRHLPGGVRVLYNPVVPDSLHEVGLAPAPAPWPADGLPVLVAAGRLSPEKGYDLLLESFARVRQERPARLVFVGSGPEGPRLAQQARVMGLAPWVTFLGFQPNPYEWLLHADVFVLSSLIESFPTVLIEAMALGKAVVAFDCPEGPREIITNEVDGLLVPPGDVHALAATVLAVLADPGLAARLGQSARRRARDFACAGAVARYERLFTEILKESVPGKSAFGRWLGRRAAPCSSASDTYLDRPLEADEGLA